MSTCAGGNRSKVIVLMQSTDLELFSLFHLLVAISCVNQRLHHDVIQLRKQLQPTNQTTCSIYVLFITFILNGF